MHSQRLCPLNSCAPARSSVRSSASVAADASIDAQLRQGIRAEYRKVHGEVRRRRTQSGRPWMLRAYEGRPLFARAANGAVPAASVTALSPSDLAVSRALDVLAAGTAKEGSRRKLSAADPNELAVALWVEVGNHAALLGADLLTGPAGCGWEAVLATFTPGNRASLFKVPHHGSVHSHYDAVWQDLLTTQPVSLAAPYRGGSRPAPAPEDVARICALSEQFWVTAATSVPAQPAAVRRTAATLNAVAKNVREPYGKCGQVQARIASSGASWSVTAASPGRPVC